MTDETFTLAGDISQYIYDQFCQRDRFRFGGEEYDLGDSELGEPFILLRASDGAQFEVDLIAEVRRGAS